ncbi:MAG: T9SS type A sorting domain-containing protein [Chitinophagales bacterium]|nr:T9SS type A sorting domain-containing protein [Chitinophagales bacterium]
MRYAFLVLFLTICVAASSQPYLDSFNINTNSSYNNSSFPRNLYGYGNTLYFSANDSVHGYELWAFFSNTTAPMRLTDIQPGTKSSVLLNIRQLAAIKGSIYFVATDSAHGNELWYINDNTPPTMAADIYTGTYGSNPTYLTVLNDDLYFAAFSKEYGSEMWVINTNMKTPKRITDVNPDSLGSVVREIAAFNNKIYFQAFTPATGSELYEYDPVQDKTMLVADIYVGNAGSSPANITVLDNKIYFSAREDQYGTELYEYDGTNPPKRLTDLNPGLGSGVYPSANMAVLNSKLYFNGYDANSSSYQLFQFDPTNNNTSMVYAINPSGAATPNDFAVYDNKLFFSAYETTAGIELWMYDGSNNPVRITDIMPGSTSSLIDNVTATGLGLYFSARGSDVGTELFRYSNYALGVQNVQFDGGVTLYPNPAKSNVYLDITLNKSQTLNTTVTDINGRVVHQSGNILYGASQYIIEIPLNELPAGSYIYQLKSNTGSIMATGRFQKL